MITSVAVSFIAGKRMLSVDIDFRDAVTMEVPDPDHCVELLALFWPGPELELRDRQEMATKGGGIGICNAVSGPPGPGGAGGRSVSSSSTQGEP